jgi:phosphohistidine phosphatase
MRLYLVRHCDAVHPAEHPDRPLSRNGEDQARRLAAWMGRNGILADEIVHSGVLRAAQTAEALSATVQPVRGVRMEPGLRPGDSAREAVDHLRFGDTSRVVVTHLPIVGHMASLLLSGNERSDPVFFRTGSIAAFEGEGDYWSLDWLIHPSLVVSPDRARVE